MSSVSRRPVGDAECSGKSTLRLRASCIPRATVRYVLKLRADAMTKRIPRLFEMDGLQRCSVCKMSFPMHTQHSVHKAFGEHMRKAHQPCPTSQVINQTTAHPMAERTNTIFGLKSTPAIHHGFDNSQVRNEEGHILNKVHLTPMPDRPPRILCRVRTSKEVTMYTCCRCAWAFRVEGSDRTAGQAAFDAHPCKDFPREECT